MGFRPEVFFPAFARAGLLVDAAYVPTTGSPVPFQAQWKRPEQLMLADEAQSVEYELEYQTADVPRLRRGDALQVQLQGQPEAFTVRTAPRPQGDGFFSRVLLDKV
jgi:hypothetical protein